MPAHYRRRAKLRLILHLCPQSRCCTTPLKMVKRSNFRGRTPDKISVAFLPDPSENTPLGEPQWVRGTGGSAMSTNRLGLVWASIVLASLVLVATVSAG